jgi:uncharacterized membrane protein (DUF485 family)
MKDKKDTKGFQNNGSGLSPKSRQLAISLAINSILLLFVYYGAMGLNIPIISIIVTWGYMLVFGGFLIAYIAYNRAFTRKEITADMLPESWSDQQKQDYINDGKIRMEKSRWMLSVIIPFLVTFMAEALYLFVWTGWLENFFI